MIAESKKPQLQAILVMDSRRISLVLRQQNFTGAWSQLYKAGDFYPDLSLKPDAHKAYLQGYIVADPSQLGSIQGTTSLYNEQTQLSTPIGVTGSRCPKGGSTNWRLPCSIRSYGWIASRSNLLYPNPSPQVYAWGLQLCQSVYPSNPSKKGSSSSSATKRQKRAASAPSIRRWS